MTSDELLSSPPGFRSGFVAIVGKANAGKSSFLNTILRTKIAAVSAKPQTTRNRILGIKHLPGGQIVFVDTPGFVKPREKSALNKYLRDEALEAVSGVDLVLLIIDAKRALVEEHHLKEVQRIFTEDGLAAPDVVALNKIDLVDRAKLLPLIKEVGALFPAPEGREAPPIIPVSVALDDGTDTILAELVRRLPEGPAMFPEDQITDRSERFLAAEIIREKLFQHLHQELPYSIAVEVEGWQESDDLIKINAVIHVERESQKAIVIGKGGKVLKEVGQAARLELEKILGVQLYLELFVRVEEDWTTTSRGLSRTGVR